MAGVKIRGAVHPGGRNMIFRKNRFGWVRYHQLISVISRPKFTKLCSPNAGGIAIQNLLIRF